MTYVEESRTDPPQTSPGLLSLIETVYRVSRAPGAVYPGSPRAPLIDGQVLLAAGLDGLKNKLEVPKAVVTNLYEMTDEERKKENIDRLPVDLNDALKYLQEDELICNVLGKHILDKYVEAKKAEWKAYKEQITKWELDEYLYKY